MSHRTYEASQYVKAVTKVYYYAADRMPWEGTARVDDVVRVEGKTEAEAETRLNQAIDQFCEERRRKYTLNYCQPVGKPTVELKVSFVDQVRRFLLQKFGP